MLALVFQRSILRRTTAETLMETPNRGASPPARPNDGTSAPYPAAVSPPFSNMFSLLLPHFTHYTHTPYTGLGFHHRIKIRIILFTHERKNLRMCLGCAGAEIMSKCKYNSTVIAAFNMYMYTYLLSSVSVEV